MSETETFQQKWTRLAKAVGEKHNADVILYTGGIDDAIADELILVAKNPRRRENVVLLLATRGGSPDAAYRIARCLQRQYKKFVLYIYGICKSAGTLVSVGANEIVLSDFGEFGPLDIQLGKRDELFETVSGLNITQALSSLNARATEVFKATLVDLRQGSGGQISTKLAAEIASNFSTSLYEKIYAQIDPAQLGSIERSVNIASDYGKRLAEKSGNNVRAGTVDKLVSGYSSHSFVIDIDEAKTLFENVRKPDEDEEELGKCISNVTRGPASQAFVMKLNGDPGDEKPQTEATERSGAGEGSGSVTDNEAAPPAAPDTQPRVRAVASKRPGNE